MRIKDTSKNYYNFSIHPGDFVTKLKQINSQSDLISMSSSVCYQGRGGGGGGAGAGQSNTCYLANLVRDVF